MHAEARPSRMSVRAIACEHRILIIDSAEKPWFIEVGWGPCGECTGRLGIRREAAGEEEAKA